MKDIKLTSYSHGAGCGCKISPEVLSSILQQTGANFSDPRLLVGNQTNDDAAVFDLGNGEAIISTTDFFMPIVDDPFDFGAIAATNAISDVYAMGGTPIMAIAILGWPIDKLSTEVAAKVLEGGKSVCAKAGIALAGGHSIDAPEPIFGLAVTGRAKAENIRRNDNAQMGDHLYITKKLGIGLVTTAQKKGIAAEEDLEMAKASMLALNQIGEQLSTFAGVNALTDVTGFGLAGHLIEMCEGSGLSASVFFDQLPLFPFVQKYVNQGCMPGGTQRNWKSYGQKVDNVSEFQRAVLADPQTSGGLLISITEEHASELEALLKHNNLPFHSLGRMTEKKEKVIEVI